MEFTEKEVREKLEELGYCDVPHSQLLQFMQDLEELVQLDSSHEASSRNERDISEIFADTTLRDIDNQQRSYSRSKPLRDVTTKVQRKAFAKETINNPMHHISFDKENLSFTDCSRYSELPSFTLSAESTADENQEQLIRPVNKEMMDSYTKRKVSRKRDGSVHIFDESSLGDESQLSDITALEEKIRNLPVVDRILHTDSNDSSHYSSSASNRSLRSSLSSNNVHSLPAFIRPSTAHPHTKRILKCDPVSRYHQFKKEWNHSKFPGESTHSSVRWNVREQMLQCETFEKPQHNYSTNNYVVPTDKKRLALRWQVRSAMARI